jgi:FkbM family methyltransferase
VYKEWESISLCTERGLEEGLDQLALQQDAEVAGEVLVFNGYDLDPYVDHHGDVIDVGAHLGFFARAVLALCPAARVECYEPDDTNFRLLQKNAPGATLHKKALWDAERSGRLNFMPFIGTPAQGQLSEKGQFPVDLITLEEILAGHREVGYLKLDCEGGEWDALAHTPTHLLERCHRIVAELHPSIRPKGFTGGAASLVRRLSGIGFRTLVINNGSSVNLMLHAWRED